MNEMEIRQHAYEAVCGHYKVAGPLDFLRTLGGHASDLKGRAGTAASSMLTRLEGSPLSPAQLSAPQGVERYDPFHYLLHPSPALAPPKLDPRQFRTDVASPLTNLIPDPILPRSGPHRPLYGNYGYEMPELSKIAGPTNFLNRLKDEASFARDGLSYKKKLLENEMAPALENMRHTFNSARAGTMPISPTALQHHGGDPLGGYMPHGGGGAPVPETLRESNARNAREFERILAQRFP